ncbi:tail protein X [Chitiniphilus eburneus]|uniref:tail protein X n=1 Tax=Chitiniphilus eburneus TaxID=2571148 RepID=UPI0035D11F47
MRVQATQGDTLDAICWRYYGRSAGVVEQALIDNPGLAALGPILPEGTAIELRDLVPAPVQTRFINLWN